MDKDVKKIIEENKRRNAVISAPFDPVSGKGSIGERTLLKVADHTLKEQWVTKEMLDDAFVAEIAKSGSIKKFLDSVGKKGDRELFDASRELLIRKRAKYDFPFWASNYATIKNKDGGKDIHFVLNRPQRRLIATYEEMRTANKPIRLILVKARQWGGSTATQLYMAWLQLMHMEGLNSLIIAQGLSTASGIKDMFDKMLKEYPLELLHDIGDSYSDSEPKIEGVGGMQNVHRVPQRNCKISIGSAERPDSCRGGDYALVHCSEVGVWKKTDGKTPEDIVRSACSGVKYKPYTMIVYESTANGTGNFFQVEYDASKRGKSMFTPMFVPWFEIEGYTFPITDYEKFATELWENRENRNVMDDREEPMAFYWKLWEMGATLEAIQWYMVERTKYRDHAIIASEMPSDDIEAFQHSGARVFDQYQVAKFRPSCRPPKFIGDVMGEAVKGRDALENVRFTEDNQGQLWLWAKPEIDEEEKISNRYLTVVDIGGRGSKADWSVILVIDRMFMMDGDKPSVVAQWYGHIDMDLLAWKSAQVAKYYDDSLLVIESNTLETKDRDRYVDGDNAPFILDEIKDYYDNLYAREQSAEDIAEGAPRKYGFHTNVKTKPEVIATLVECIREQLYTERDERALDEFLTYERKPNGAFGAIIGKHDDLLMTRAIGLHICFKKMDLPSVVEKKDKKVINKKVLSVASM